MSSASSDSEESSGKPDIQKKSVSETCRCPICLLVLALPVSWPCGHNFCQSCSLTMLHDYSDAETGKVKCPSCRAPFKLSLAFQFQINRVLQELLVKVFGDKTMQKREAEVKKFVARLDHGPPRAQDGHDMAGEGNGEHDLGWQVVVANQDLVLTNNGKVSGNRNMVRDAHRFTHRLCLVPVQSAGFVPTKLSGFTSWRLQIAVMEMEEDEVEANGGSFPVMVNMGDHDDDNAELIRTSFEDEMDCQVWVDGNELGTNVTSYLCERGVATFFFGDLFEECEAEPGQQIKITFSTQEEGLYFTLRFEVEKRRDKTERWLVSQNDEEEESEQSAAADSDSSSSSLGDFIVDEDEEEEEEEEDVGTPDSRWRRRNSSSRSSNSDDEEEVEEISSPEPRRQRRRSNSTISSDDSDHDDNDSDDDRAHVPLKRRRLVISSSSSDDDEEEDE